MFNPKSIRAALYYVFSNLKVKKYINTESTNVNKLRNIWNRVAMLLHSIMVLRVFVYKGFSETLSFGKNKSPAENILA